MNKTYKKKLDDFLEDAEKRVKEKETLLIEKVCAAMPTDELIELVDLLENEPDNSRINELWNKGIERVKK